MLMLDAYFDESGHADDKNTPFLGIAGCLGTARGWVEVERDWKNILAKEDLKCWHMNEFAHSTGEYARWKKDEPRRKRVYGELWNIILEARPFAIGCFVRLEDYKTVLTDETRQSLQDAYYLCYLQVLAYSMVFLTKDDVPDATITTVFDAKKGFMDYAHKLYDGVIAQYPEFREVIPYPVFRDMREIVQLQIADIIAYESYKEFERRENHPNRKPRWEPLLFSGIIVL